MEKVVVDLPDEMVEYITEQATAAGMAQPGDYIRELILESQRQKALEEIERLAEQALDSGPATPWTAADFEEIRRKLREKYGDPNGAKK
jgi:antitoxin ParD1/3/4